MHCLEPQVLKAEQMPFETKRVDQNKTLLRTLELATEIPAEGYTPKFVEIGVFEGRTSNVIMLSLNQLGFKCNFYAVDLNQPYYRTLDKKEVGWMPQNKFNETCKNVLGKGPCNGQFIAGHSCAVAEQFDNKTIHWCFIDGCHCFECASNDIETYGPKLASGGYLIVHDTTERASGGKADQWYHDKGNPRKFGVIKAVKNSKVLNEQFELFFEIKSGYGLQVWKKK
jgi:hypothetical protein